MPQSLLKTLLAREASRLVHYLPWSSREAILDSLIDRLGPATVLRRYHVESLTVSGANGRITGSIDDRVVLGKYMRSGKWAWRMLDVFKELFTGEGGGTYLDIGANIGLTLVPIARLPGMQSVGFEPEPRNFSHLARNVTENCPGCDVRIERIALGNTDGLATLSLSPDNFGDHRLEPGPHGRSVEQVQVRRLDQMGLSMRVPLAAKIDTQGAEPLVIEGGYEVLKSAELLSLEFTPFAMSRLGVDADIILSFLAKNFREAAITRGDSEDELIFEPVSVATERLHSINRTRDRKTGYYFDVMARK